MRKVGIQNMTLETRDPSDKDIVLEPVTVFMGRDITCKKSSSGV